MARSPQMQELASQQAALPTLNDDEAKVSALCAALNTGDHEEVFVLYVSSDDDGTPTYGIGFTRMEPGQQYRTTYAPLHYFHTAAEVAASMMKSG